MEGHGKLSKPEKPKEKEIKIEPREDVQDLIKKAKVAKPVKIPSKSKRGRPRKIKPDSTLAKYKGFPLAVEINKGVCFAFNTTFTKPNLMKPEDTNIGEAIIYSGEYYGWKFFEHPALILSMAILGTFWSAWQKREAEKKPKTEKVKPE